MTFLNRGSAPKRLRATAMAMGVMTLAACPNDHVFRLFPSCATREAQVDLAIEPSRATDILIVVDNSGSMQEEQDELIGTFFDPNCPININNVQEEYRNPSLDTVFSELMPRCGFIQILAAFEVDWRVGVITTDISDCDNDLDPSGGAPADWGRRPQRGCLQVAPNASWPAAEGRKFIQQGDPDVDLRFKETLENVRTYGNFVERGLDAVEMFVTGAPKSPVAGCENDATSFIRDDARLVIIFLTDEDDCSHVDTVVDATDPDLTAKLVGGVFPDENAGETCTEFFQPDFVSAPTFALAIDQLRAESPDATITSHGSFCYLDSHRGALRPVDHFVDAVKGRKGDDVAAAVIAGALVDDANGTVTPAGCYPTPSGPSGQCYQSWGLSNNSTVCGGNLSEPCCQAEPGTRYYEFASALGAENALANSICYDSFRETMVKTAAFAARVGFVQLPEPPLSPAAIQVELAFDGPCAFEDLREPEDDPNSNVCRVPRIPDGEDPTGRDGWQLQGATVRFYGSWTPQPGQEIRVRSLAASDTDVPGCTTFEAADAGG